MKKEDEIDTRLVICFCPEYFCHPIADALSKLPDNVFDFVAEKCVFVSQEIARADSPGQMSFYLNFRDPRLKNKSGIIVLNSFLFSRQPRDIAFTVAHEVAHCLNDDIPPWVTNPLLSEKDMLKNEIRADKLAVKWLSKHYKESALMKRCRYWKKGG